MPSCDDFQILIEQRLLGALAEARRPALEAHLADCSSCRGYEAEAAEAQRALAVPSGARAPVEWSRIERAIGRERALLDGEWALVACGMLVLDLTWLLFFSWEFVRPWALPILAVEASAWLAFGLRERRALRHRVAAVPSGELMDWLRRHAAWRRSSAGQVRWCTVVGLMALAFAWALAGRHGRGVDAALLSRLHWALLLVGAFVVAVLVWVEAVQLPRARRECASLQASR
jgi:predicted anti-sigma-YlaC factor YlaD